MNTVAAAVADVGSATTPQNHRTPSSPETANTMNTVGVDAGRVIGTGGDWDGGGGRNSSLEATASAIDTWGVNEGRDRKTGRNDGGGGRGGKENSSEPLTASEVRPSPHAPLLLQRMHSTCRFLHTALIF